MTGRKTTIIFGVEIAFAILVILAIIKVATFLFAAGYLPPPFFHDTNDTFMDWYNTAYWAHTTNEYDVWRSVYPPLSFVFLKIFSRGSCYPNDPLYARVCDPVGAWALFAFVILNFVIIYMSYRVVDKRTALIRATALGVGLPMLFAWERGNLIVPCFTAFALAHGRVLRSARLRWLAAAVTINFKPYLVLPILTHVLRRRWRWAEGALFAAVVLYIVTYVFIQDGSPLLVLNDITLFTDPTLRSKFDTTGFSSSYSAIVNLIESDFPLMNYVGSRLMEALDLWCPIFIKAGVLGVGLCFLAALWRPTAVPVFRLGALSLSVLLTATNPGGYTEVFLIFLVFMEPWKGPLSGLVLVVAYILCIPWDVTILKISHEVEDSYLIDRTVGYDLGVTLGVFVRPALILLLEFGLIGLTLANMIQGWKSERRGRTDLTSPAVGGPSSSSVGSPA